MVIIKHRATGRMLQAVDRLQATTHSLASKTLPDADLAGMDLAGADLSEALLTRANLECADLRYANLHGTYMRGANLRGADLTHADLRYANLFGADLTGATLDRALILRAGMNGACFTEARMRHVNLQCANLSFAQFTDADMRYADLRRADLFKAQLKNADLRNASLAATELSLAVLDEARLEGATVAQAYYDDETRWPDGFDPREAIDWSAIQAEEQQAIRPTVITRVARRRPGLMRVWTTQPYSLWLQLQQARSLTVDPVRIFSLDRPGYDWLRDQMALRLSDYGGHYPWWAWYGEKPRLWNLRADRRPGHRYVRLELQLPPERVVVSERWTWHLASCHDYVYLSQEDGKAWEAQFTEDLFGMACWPLPEPWRSQIYASWERIFDLEGLAAGGLWSGTLLQALFERLDLDDVVEVTEFSVR